jgi:hypothetical protein
MRFRRSAASRTDWKRHDESPSASPSEWDLAVLEVLQSRDGIATFVQLADNSRLRVYDIAWGYDSADTHSHVTSNISPGVEGTAVDFFTTDRVVSLVDPETGEPLLVSATFARHRVTGHADPAE